MAEQHEHLLGELESSEGQLGAILRYAYYTTRILHTLGFSTVYII